MAIERRVGKRAGKAVLAWVFLCSGTALAGLLSIKGELVWVAAGIPIAALALAWLSFRCRFAERVLASFCLGRAALSLVLAAYAASLYTGIFQTHLLSLGAAAASAQFAGLIGRYGAAFAVCAGVAAIPALFIYLYWFTGWFFEWMRAAFGGADRVERRYLLAAALVFSAVIALVYARTDVFYGANAASDNTWDKVDIVYSSDSSLLNEQNVFYNIGATENDIRQPLFGAFAAPFALAASLVSRLLLLPGAYYALLQMLQGMLLALSLVLIARMIGAAGAVKALLLVCLSLLYPTLLYLLNMEQYVFAVFWLILLIWLSVCSARGGRDLAWAAATGSMLTSGVFLLLVPGEGTPKQKLKKAVSAVAGFILITIVLGRTAMVAATAEKLRFLMQFTGEKLPFSARLMQYVQFAASCLIAPAAQIERYANGIWVFHQTEITHWSLLGAACIAAAAAGFALNRKRRYAQICAGWAAFSFLLLCVLGWGTSEHALVLYTLYFSWAFVSLIVLLITRVLANARAAQIAALSAAAIALAAVNLPGIAQLVRFGLAYYPLG